MFFPAFTSKQTPMLSALLSRCRKTTYSKIKACGNSTVTEGPFRQYFHQTSATCTRKVVIGNTFLTLQMHQLNNCFKISQTFGSYILDNNEICILMRTVTEGHKNGHGF